MAAALIFVCILLVTRMYSFYFKHKTVVVSRPDPTTVLTNRQATALYGNSPGVIVAGIEADNVYRNADGRGEFGLTSPSAVVPELQEVVVRSQQSPLIVAIRASESGADDVSEAVVYQEKQGTTSSSAADAVVIRESPEDIV